MQFGFHAHCRSLKKDGKRRLGAARAAMFVLLAVFRAAVSVEGAEMKNLVPNGDFSELWLGSPARWEAAGNEENVDQHLEAVLENGNAVAKLTCTRCEGSGGSDHAMIAQTGGAQLEEGKYYEFSCRARAEGLKGRSVTVALRDTDGWQDCGLLTSLTLRKSWKEFRHLFQAARSVHTTGRLQFWFNEPGTFCLDDVRIVEVSMQEIEFTDTVAPTDGKNLVPNGSFELGRAGWSSLGEGAGWGNMCRLHGRIETSGGTHGPSFLRVPLGGNETPVFYFDYFEPVVRRETRALAANLGWIPVSKGAAYTISCDMRASVDGVAAVLGVRAKDPEGGVWRNRADYRHTVKLSRSWQRYSFTFRPAQRYVFVTVGPDLEEEMRVDVDIDAIQLEQGERATGFEPRSPLEVTIEPSEAAGIFTEGDPAALSVRAYNHSAAAMNLSVAFSVTDFFDRPARLPAVSLDVPATSLAEHDVALPRDWKGYYRVQASYQSRAITGSQTVRLAVVPRRTQDDSVLGINHAFNDGYLVQLAKKAGVTWYRDWSLKWNHLEPSPGKYQWHVGDAQVNRVLEEGVKLMALMPPFPSAEWISEADADMEGSAWAPVRQAWAPKKPERLGQFVEKTVARYKDRIQVWEFLNEPIYTSYALPRAGDYTPADYVRLLEVVSAAMRRSDPECKVMAGIGGGANTLTREVMEAGGLEHLDILNLHIYPGARPPESFLPGMDELLAMMDEHGGRKPIWMTEFSYYGEDDLSRRPFVPAPGSWSEARILEDERQCAEFTVRFFVVMMARGVEKFFVHSGASGTVNQPNLECCIFKYGGVPCKIFPALAVFTDLMGPQPKYAAEKPLGEEGHCIAFETGQHAVLVLWSPYDEMTVAAPAEARCVDLMGNEVTERPITVSSTPVYLLGPAGEARELVASLSAEGD